MDDQQFDELVRRLGGTVTRRAAIGGLVAGLPLSLEASALGKTRKQKSKGKGKGKDKSKDKGRDQHRAHAQAVCWRAGACYPSKGSNVSQCDLSSYSTFPTQDCTGCNVSQANLQGVSARNVDFTKANLSGACLVNADFTGATFAKNTNLSGAIFCNTKMPDGSTNNTRCASGTACCGTASPTSTTLRPTTTTSSTTSTTTAAPICQEHGGFCERDSDCCPCFENDINRCICNTGGNNCVMTEIG